MTLETITKPYRVGAGEGLANVWWKTGRLTVKAGGAETGGSFSQVETDDPRGTATPVHVHHNGTRRSSCSRARSPSSPATSGSTSPPATTCSLRATSPTRTSSARRGRGC